VSGRSVEGDGTERDPLGRAGTELLGQSWDRVGTELGQNYPNVDTFGLYSCTLLVMEVGIRQLRNHLSDYLDRVREGDEVVVTDRGAAVARIVPIEGGRTLDRLIAEGLVSPTAKTDRMGPKGRIRANGSVSDLVADQRR
jgi:prevent-host-death family protein